MRGGHGEETEQVIQVAFEAGYRARAAVLPFFAPQAEGALRFVAAARAIDGRGFGDARAFLAQDFVGDIAQFVGPAELLRHARIDQRERGAQALAAVADDELQIFAGEPAQKKIL